ncbi:hypothetical protein [Microbacterium sp. No. 7]|uniref:hypothetical protein n=1 Tax=Microbacterium sp. No. 7 TaxID=1714373 RepID=UPI0012E16D87|nr:hypothetical protein [Microbacterium sp. No. 7]
MNAEETVAAGRTAASVPSMSALLAGRSWATSETGIPSFETCRIAAGPASAEPSHTYRRPYRPISEWRASNRRLVRQCEDVVGDTTVPASPRGNADAGGPTWLDKPGVEQIERDAHHVPR